MAEIDRLERATQNLLAKCGGDWELLARMLLHTHTIVVAARADEKKRLRRLYGFTGKDGLIRGKSLTEILAMLAQLDHFKRQQDTRKATIARLSLSRKEKEEWEKVLAKFNARQKRRVGRKPLSALMFNFDPDTESAHDDDCPGCNDCQGVK